MAKRQLNLLEIIKIMSNIFIDARFARKKKGMYALSVKIQLRFFHSSCNKLLGVPLVVSYIIKNAYRVQCAHVKMMTDEPRLYLAEIGK